MSQYKRKYNPVPNTSLVPVNTAIRMRDTVASQVNLPLSGNVIGDGRVTIDTGHLYVWTLDNSIGLLTDWVDQGNFIDVSWDSLSGKPSSSISNIDDAVSKRHALHADDQDLSGKSDVGHLHTESNITSLVGDLKVLTLNIMLNAFRIAQQGSLTLLKMVDGFVDEYVDESGIDVINSINQIYNSDGEYYINQDIIDEPIKLLLHLNNNVTDSELTPKTVTNNNVTFSAPGKFGGYAGSFNGGNSYLSIPNSSDFNFGTDDFTLECWVYLQATDSSLFTQGYYTMGQNGNYQGKILTDGSIVFDSYDEHSNEEYIASVAGVVPLLTWCHIAYIKNGTSLKIYVNGTEVASGTINKSLGNNSSDLYIGWGADFGEWMDGNIDEVRISKGIARWTSNFTPPTMEYPLVFGNLLLLSNAIVADSTPDSLRIVLFEEDVNSITLNTDIKAYISRDNGVAFSEVTLEDEGNYIDTARILSGIVDISSQPSGTNIKYKIQTFNSKILKIHGTGLSWR